MEGETVCEVVREEVGEWRGRRLYSEGGGE